MAFLDSDRHIFLLDISLEISSKDLSERQGLRDNDETINIRNKNNSYNSVDSMIVIDSCSSFSPRSGEARMESSIDISTKVSSDQPGEMS